MGQMHAYIWTKLLSGKDPGQRNVELAEMNVKEFPINSKRHVVHSVALTAVKDNQKYTATASPKMDEMISHIAKPDEVPGALGAIQTKFRENFHVRSMQLPVDWELARATDWLRDPAGGEPWLMETSNVVGVFLSRRSLDFNEPNNALKVETTLS